MIEHLFARLTAYYGARFAGMWHCCDPELMRSVWAEELSDLSVDELSRGLAACRDLTHPPTLPEFRRLCRPALDYERAYHEAVEQMHRRNRGEDVWSHPAVYWAAVRLGSDLRAHPYEGLRRRWQAALDEAIESVRTGRLPDRVPPRRPELPAPGERQTPPEEALARISEVRAVVWPGERPSEAPGSRHGDFPA